MAEARPPGTRGRLSGSAETTADVGRALRLFSKQPRTVVNLYKIYELTRKHPNSNSWKESPQSKRFSHSANHPEALGEEARHAVSNKQPPVDPMSLSGSEDFIREILEWWVDEVWDGLQGDG